MLMKVRTHAHVNMRSLSNEKKWVSVIFIGNNETVSMRTPLNNQSVNLECNCCSTGCGIAGEKVEGISLTSLIQKEGQFKSQI